MTNFQDLLNPIRNRTLQQVLGKFTGSERPELTDVAKTVLPTIVLNKEPIGIHQAFEIGNVWSGNAKWRFDIATPTQPILRDTGRGRNFYQPLFDLRELASFILHRSFVIWYNPSASSQNCIIRFGMYLSTNSPIVGSGGADSLGLLVLTRAVSSGSTAISFFGADMDSGYPSIPPPGQVIDCENISNYFTGFWMELEAPVSGIAALGNISIDTQFKATNQNNNQPSLYTPI